MPQNFKIQSLSAKEILNSSGNPTVQLDLETDFGSFAASVPSGISTGKYEAVEIHDKDGKGVKKAIENIEKIIFPALSDKDFANQEEFDRFLVELDGTENKSVLGANAILPVSIAALRAIAAAKNIPPHQYISEISGINTKLLPKPSFNMIEGGKHAPLGPAFQEFMIIPDNLTFGENFVSGLKIYKKLGDILKKKFGKLQLSAEGAFSASVSIDGALNFLCQAAQGENFKIAIDAAASSFYKNEFYNVDDRMVMRDELIDIYQYFISRYPIFSIEDPFFEEDFGDMSGLAGLTIFGDDLLTSNVGRMKIAKERNACDGLILKPNQIGTITETIEAAKLARSYDWKIMVSNRAGETEDDFIADLAVGIGADFIKSGAPYPAERMAKYNRLLAIEKELNQ